MTSNGQGRGFRNPGVSLRKLKLLQPLTTRCLAIILGVLLISFTLMGCLPGNGDEAETADSAVEPVGNGDEIETPADSAVDSVIDDLQGIVVLCNLPDNGLHPASRDSLIEKITKTENAYLSGQPCAPIEFLDIYLEEVQMLWEPDNPLFEQLYNRGRMSISNMILTNDWECTDHPRVIDDEDAEQQEQVQLTSSTTRGFTANILFAEPRLQTIEVQGQAFTEIQIPGLPMRPGDVGLPGIPSIRRLVAIPRDGEIKVQVTPNVFEKFKANVYPYQPEPVD